MPDVAVKPGAHREATLYKALDGAGAEPGLTIEEHRERASALAATLELPVWRRSGFWTTSLRDLDFDALEQRSYADGEIPTMVAGLQQRAGILVQRGDSVVDVELDPELASRGVILTSLEQAAAEHRELVERYFRRRLPYDRDKLSAAVAANWRGGAFLYVPPEVVIEAPIDVVYVLDEDGVAQYGHTLAIGDHHSEFRLREWGFAEGELAGGFRDDPAQALHARASELYLEDGARCRLSGMQDWGRVHDVVTRVVEVGRDAYCHWLPSLLGGQLVREHLELAVAEPGGDMALRGLFVSEAHEHLDVFGVDLHETGPSGGDVHWRGAATGHSRASFEGLIQINPGAQKSHTYLQIHTMMLSPQAKIDAIPSVLVSADDVSASHGGTVGELDEALIFYMQSRGLDRPAAVRVIVEGFFEPLIQQLDDPEQEQLVRDRIAAKLSAAAADIEAYATSR